jgi:TRAP-type mannitol/chloroaromatic compound transport system permease small subunit
VQRYWFEMGSVRLQESITYMHAAVLLLAAAYTLAAGGHVRVDIFYSKMTPIGKARVDLIGTLLLLMPFSFFLMAYSWDYVALSWQIRESSQEAGGLPFPFPTLMKSFIPGAALLLFLQGVVLLMRSVQTLRTRNI